MSGGWQPVAAGSAYPATRSVGATGLIIVRNGERTIAAAVASLSWCERVIVVDQASEDRTAARARGAGAEVQPGPITGVVEPARRAAVDLIGTGWVVMLDADEMVPAPLARELARLVAPGSPWDAVRLARKNLLLGRWARGAGWWPDPQLRVFRAEAVDLPERVHGAIEVRPGARCHDLVGPAESQPDLALVHFNYSGYADWFERMNRYTTMQAPDLTLRRVRPGVAFARSLTRRYVRQGGWRLGRYGFDISVLGASYDWLLVQKAAELARGGEAGIQNAYDETARQILADRDAVRGSGSS